MQVARATARSADPKDHATEIEPTGHAFAVRVHSSEKKSKVCINISEIV